MKASACRKSLRTFAKSFLMRLRTKAVNLPVVIEISDFRIDVDLTSQNKEPFRIEDIGGYGNYYRIKDEVTNLLRKSRETTVSHCV